LYRVRQFWRTISLKTDPHELEKAHAWLSAEQWEVFTQLQPGEQDHAVTIFRKLQAQGEDQPDLLVAALLHDIGKLRYRLNPLERVMVVLIKAVMPEEAQRVGCIPQDEWDSLPGWRKPFVLAEQHAEWGAGMARQLAVSPLTETLIRLHHQPHSPNANDLERDMLHKLWLVDNES